MAEREARKSLQTPSGTAVFVHLFEPYAIKPKNPKEQPKDPQYSVMLVFDKETVPQLKELKLAAIAAAEAKFGADTRERIKKGKIQMPWRDASDYDEYGAPFDQEGAVMIQFKSNNAPGIVDKRARDIMNQKEIYPGCKMRVSYFPWAYDTNGNKGVTMLLNNCQKTGDGPKLAGRLDASEEFGAVEGDDDTGDDDDLDI